MKRIGSRLPLLLLSLLLLCGTLVACAEVDHDYDYYEDVEEDTFAPDTPYRLEFQNNTPYEGACTALLTLNSDYTEDFSVNIPAESPDGYAVTHFVRNGHTCEAFGIPHILSEETYQEKIYRPLVEIGERGEFGTKAEAEFYIAKVDAFFQLVDPNKLKTDEEKQAAIQELPIIDPEGANTPMRIFAEEASYTEMRQIQKYLQIVSFTSEDIQEEIQNLRNKIKRLKIDTQAKAAMLKEYRFYENDHLVGLTLPDSLRCLDVRDLPNYEKIATLKNGIYYLSNWAIDADSGLHEISLKEGTVGIAKYAFNGCTKVEKLILPESLKYICKTFQYYYGSQSPTLTDIRYLGTKAKWESVEKEDDWLFDHHTHTLHCTDGDILIE